MWQTVLLLCWFVVDAETFTKADGTTLTVSLQNRDAKDGPFHILRGHPHYQIRVVDRSLGEPGQHAIVTSSEDSQVHAMAWVHNGAKFTIQIRSKKGPFLVESVRIQNELLISSSAWVENWRDNNWWHHSTPQERHGSGEFVAIRGKQLTNPKYASLPGFKTFRDNNDLWKETAGFINITIKEAKCKAEPVEKDVHEFMKIQRNLQVAAKPRPAELILEGNSLDPQGSGCPLDVDDSTAVSFPFWISAHDDDDDESLLTRVLKPIRTYEL